MTDYYREKLLEQIREWLEAERGLDRDAIEFDTPFKELGLDSLDLIEMAMEWEQEYGVLIDDQNVADIVTFGDAIDFVLANGPVAA